MPLSVNIRPVHPSDDQSLSKICLLTGAAGSSAEALHSIPELLGLIFALPYNRLDTTFGFVLVEQYAVTQSSISTDEIFERVVGYILGTTDSKKFQEVAEREWWPALRDKYTKEGSPRTQADQHSISIIHSPYTIPDDIIARFPAHVHIDILPSHQRKSYGRKLMAAAVSFLSERGHTGLFVGLDPSNEAAKKFYGRLGFRKIDREGGEWWGLDFDQFRD